MGVALGAFKALQALHAFGQFTATSEILQRSCHKPGLESLTLVTHSHCFFILPCVPGGFGIRKNSVVSSQPHTKQESGQ